MSSIFQGLQDDQSQNLILLLIGLQQLFHFIIVIPASLLESSTEGLKRGFRGRTRGGGVEVPTPLLSGLFHKDNLTIPC